MKTTELQRNAFDPPPALSKFELGCRIPVKCYEGDPVSDTPEFQEVCQKTMPLARVVGDESGRLQFKVNVDVNDDSEVIPQVNSILRSFIASKKSTPIVTNVRMSGKGWQIPCHFDAVDQYIFHVHGQKTWRIHDKAWHCRPGDILFIPAGVWHAAHNESEAAAIANVAYESSRTPRLSQRFCKLWPERAKAIIQRKDDP